MELRNNPIYIARLWIVMAHCCLVVISMWAAGALLFPAKPHLSALGFIGFLLFAITELFRTALVLFAVNRSWREAYAVAQSESAREFYRNTLAAFLGVNDALFFIFFVAFDFGLLCYGLALLHSTRWERRLGWMFLAWFLFSVPTWVETISGNTALVPLFAWVGPYFQPAARAAIGIWLWSKTKSEMQ